MEAPNIPSNDTTDAYPYDDGDVDDQRSDAWDSDVEFFGTTHTLHDSDDGDDSGAHKYIFRYYQHGRSNGDTTLDPEEHNATRIAHPDSVDNEDPSNPADGPHSSANAQHDGNNVEKSYEEESVPDPKKRNYAEWLERTGPLIRKMVPDDIPSSDVEVASKPGFQVLCTYSWKDTEENTIYVPGSPNRWNSSLTGSDGKGLVNGGQGIEVDEDSGPFHIDENIARCSDLQYLPMFQALAILNPSIRLDDVDIVTSRTIMRMLLNHANDKAEQKLCLECKLVGSTMFLVRTGHNGWADCQPDNYGRNFEKEFTEATLEETSGHHRAITYSFGELKIILRHEADAFITGEFKLSDGKSKIIPDVESTDDNSQVEGTDDELLPNLIRSGTFVPQSALVELKAAKDKPSNTVSRAMPQAWFGRTPFLIVGMHKPGTRKSASEDVEKFSNFHTAQIRDMTKKISDWEAKDSNQANLRKLAGFLKTLRDFALASPQRKVLFRKLHREDSLEIFEGSERMEEALPEDLVRRFWTHKTE